MKRSGWSQAETVQHLENFRYTEWRGASSLLPMHRVFHAVPPHCASKVQAMAMISQAKTSLDVAKNRVDCLHRLY